MADDDLSKQGPKHELRDLPFGWERTTVPQTPFSLPISVKINVAADAIQIHALREGTFGELMGMKTDVNETLVLDKADILSVQVFLMPDIPDDAEPRWIENDTSLVVIRHRDPAEVEPYFESVFSSWKAYWAKALVKLLKERTSIEASVIHENDKTRKRRLAQESID